MILPIISMFNIGLLTVNKNLLVLKNQKIFCIVFEIEILFENFTKTVINSAQIGKIKKEEVC